LEQKTNITGNTTTTTNMRRTNSLNF